MNYDVRRLSGGPGGRPAGPRAFRPARGGSARRSCRRSGLDIETLIDVAFWTSLRREEGYVPTISLALVPPEATPHPMLFARPLPLDRRRRWPRSRRRSSAPGIHLGVSRVGRRAVGVGHDAHAAAVLPGARSRRAGTDRGQAAPRRRAPEVRQHRRARGDQVKIVDEAASSLPDCPSLLTSLLGFDTPASWSDSVNVLVQLAVSMRAHKRGGLLLVVPAGSRPVARVDRVADPIRARSAVLAAGRADAQDERRARPALAGRARTRRRRHRRPDRRRRRDDHHRPLRPAGLRREDHAPARLAAGRADDGDRADRGGRGRRSSTRRRSAAPGICRPRSSSTISATPSRWSRRRTAASRCSRGRRARTWCTRTAWKPPLL